VYVLVYEDGHRRSYMLRIAPRRVINISREQARRLFLAGRELRLGDSDLDQRSEEIRLAGTVAGLAMATINRCIRQHTLGDDIGSDIVLPRFRSPQRQTELGYPTGPNVVTHVVFEGTDGTEFFYGGLEDQMIDALSAAGFWFEPHDSCTAAIYLN
jgi:hypothetical protein